MKCVCIKLIKIAVFLTILICMLLAIPRILGISTVTGIKTEPEKTIDYLVIGDSLAYSSISPMQIFKKQGYTGYNLGKPGQYFQNGFYSLTEALEEQKPKIVFVEANSIFRERNVKSGIEQTIGILTQTILPVFENHNQWKNLLKNEGYDSRTKKKETNDLLKGFKINEKVKGNAGKENLTKTEEKKKIPILSRYYLDKLVELSQERSFDLVFYSAPSPKNWTYALHNSIEEYTKANNIEYLDFNLAKKELKIDWLKDTYDRGDHLNLSGATKVTHNIGRYLYNLGTLVDHRNDQAYKNWGRFLMEYNERIEKNN